MYSCSCFLWDSKGKGGCVEGGGCESCDVCRGFCLCRWDVGLWVGFPTEFCWGTFEVLHNNCYAGPGQNVFGMKSFCLVSPVDKSMGLVDPLDVLT